MNKTEDIEILLFTHDPDVTIITETWLRGSIPDEAIIPDSHEIIRHDRDSRGGGVAIIVKKGSNYAVVNHDSNVEMVWIVLNYVNLKLFIGAVYRPPSADLSTLESFQDFVREHRKRYSHVIIGGDFNLPKINWETPIAEIPCRHADLLLDTIFSYDLKQLVQSPTRVTANSSSTLDLIFVSCEVEKFGFSVDILPGIADHKVVIFRSSLTRITDPVERKTSQTILDFNNAQDESILDFLEQKFDMFTDMANSVHYTVNELCTVAMKGTFISQQKIGKWNAVTISLN